MSESVQRAWISLLACATVFGAERAQAQFPDLWSATECPGCAAALGVETRFGGIWSTPLTSQDDPAWELEDFLCVAACTPEARAAATALLRDPANARRPTLELYEAAVHANARSAAGLLTPAARAAAANAHEPTRSPRFACESAGFAAQIVSPWPLEIVPHPAGFVLRYEEFGVQRLVQLVGAKTAQASHPRPFGVSHGRLERGTLVVDTRDIPAGRLYDWFGGGAHSAELRAVERYSVSADGNELLLELTFHDPQTLREPLMLSKRWRRAPDTELASHGCDVMAAELDNVFADHVDLRKLDRRRGL